MAIRTIATKSTPDGRELALVQDTRPLNGDPRHAWAVRVTNALRDYGNTYWVDERTARRWFSKA